MPADSIEGTLRKALAEIADAVPVDGSDSAGAPRRRGARRAPLVVAAAAAVLLFVGLGVGLIVMDSDGDGARVDTAGPPVTAEQSGTPDELGGRQLLAQGDFEIPGVLIPAGRWSRVGGTELARSQRELRDLWQRADLPGSPPDVDFARDVVLYFGPDLDHCTALDVVALVRSDEDGLYPSAVARPREPGERSCVLPSPTPHPIVIVVDRSDLPSTGFELWLGPGACCEPDRTVVPGEPTALYAPVPPDGELPIGEPHGFHAMHCGPPRMSLLGASWTTDEEVPAAWNEPPVLEQPGPTWRLLVERLDADRLAVSAAGETLVFERDGEPVPCR